jgi:release factor glutamine methyltransferase
MNIKEALQRTTVQLAHVSESASLDASLLLSKATGFTKLELFMKETEVLTENQLDVFNGLVQRRLKYEPVAYILGEKEFWGLHFFVEKGVLIPRPDTETLVATLLALIPNVEFEGRVADLGTGSGAILLSILSELPHFKGVGVDKNDTALKIAQKNAENLGFSERVQFKKSDWLDGVDETFHVIVSNPPYIETSTIQGLMEDVKAYEPVSALDGGEDGLECYRSLLKSAYDKLEKGGLLLLEIGYNKKETVAQLLQNKFEQVECFKDLAGHDRVMAAIKTR